MMVQMTEVSLLNICVKQIQTELYMCWKGDEWQNKIYWVTLTSRLMFLLFFRKPKFSKYIYIHRSGYVFILLGANIDYRIHIRKSLEIWYLYRREASKKIFMAPHGVLLVFVNVVAVKCLVKTIWTMLLRWDIYVWMPWCVSLCVG